MRVYDRFAIRQPPVHLCMQRCFAAWHSLFARLKSFKIQFYYIFGIDIKIVHRRRRYEYAAFIKPYRKIAPRTISQIALHKLFSEFYQLASESKLLFIKRQIVIKDAFISISIVCQKFFPI